MRYIRPEYNKSWPAALSAVFVPLLAALILAGCQNPFTPPSDSPGMGTFSLTIGGQASARTITPNLPGAANVDYDLVFTPRADNDHPGFTVSGWTPGDTVEIYSGQWALTVHAYVLDGTTRHRFATGSHVGYITIVPGSQAGAEVYLTPLSVGLGTFAWEIAFPHTLEIDTATMEIVPLSPGDWTQPDPSPLPLIITAAIAGDPGTPGVIRGSLGDIPAGRYRVVFRLVSTADETATISEVLHIYPNLTSQFTPPSLLDHFPVSLLGIILGALDTGDIPATLSTLGIRYGHFGLLGILGIEDEDYLDDVAGRFGDLITAAAPRPSDKPGLKALVDAALIDIAFDDLAYRRANFYWTQAIAEAAINAAAVNAVAAAAANTPQVSQPEFSWPSTYTVGVTVGDYEVPNITFVPVPVTSIAITGGTAIRHLEATRTTTLTATVQPPDARYPMVGWVIPNQAHEAYVGISPDPAQADQTITITVTGNAAGDAVLRAYSVDHPEVAAAEVTVRVYPLGAGRPITGVVVRAPTSFTIESDGYSHFYVELVPPDTTQRDLVLEGFDSAMLTVPTATTVDMDSTGWPIRVDGLERISPPGFTTITVRSAVNTDASATVVVTVVATPREVTVTPSEVSVARGGTQQFSSTVAGPPGVSQTVAWTVEPEEYATISPAGLLTLLPDATIGDEVIVRATAADTNPPVFGTATITVLPPVLGEVIIDSGPRTVIRGQGHDFTATLLPLGAVGTVTWTLVDTNHGLNGVTLSDYGSPVIGRLAIASDSTLAHGNTFGVRTTVVDHPDVSHQITVTVSVPPTGITITSPHTTITRGDHLDFSATIEPTGAAGNIEWSVFPMPAGVSMDSTTGRLTVGGTTIADGTVLTVTASVSGLEPGMAAVTPVTRQITVRVPPANVTIDSPVATIIRGTTQAFTATAGLAGAYQGVTWSVEPSTAGSFTNNVLTIHPGTPPGNVTIRATTGFPGSTVSGTATIAVVYAAPNLVVTPASTTIERGGAAVSFTASMPSPQPEGIPDIDDVSWRLEPSTAGTITTNPATGPTITVTVSDGNKPHVSSFQVIATVPGHRPGDNGPVNEPATVSVTVQIREPGDFDVIPPPFPPEHGGIVITPDDPTFSLIGTQQIINFTNRAAFNAVRWYFEGEQITNTDDTVNDSFVGVNEATLTVRRMMNDRLLSVGTYFLTVEALMRIYDDDGVFVRTEWRSRRIELRVTM